MDDDSRTTTTTTADRRPDRPAQGRSGARATASGLVALLVAVVVLGVGAFLFFGNVLADADDDPVVVPEREGRLSADAYADVELGTAKEEVLTALRPVVPTGTRVVERYESREPETVAAECVYYDREDGRAGQQYRFCFVEDVLVGKTVVLAGDPGEGSAVVEEGAVDG